MNIKIGSKDAFKPMRKVIFSLFTIIFLSIIIWIFVIHHPKTYNCEFIGQKKNIIPVAILGSGPAGLSAALYSARLGIQTVVFEGPKPGGQLTETGFVENWPGVARARGADIMQNLRTNVQQLGVQLVPLTIKSVNLLSWPFALIADDGSTLHALSLIITTGSAPRVLDIPGEREYWGKGVTTCALCDAPYYKNRDVVVVGGGDGACEEVVQLAPYARRITLLVRGENLRASAVMQQRIYALPQVLVATYKQIQKITGDGTWVTGITVFDIKQKKTEHIAVNGIFLAIGYEPRTQLFASQLKLSIDGYIIIDEKNQHTSVAGVFAAGDVADPTYRQAGVAAGAGIKAAIEAVHFLQNHGWSQSCVRLLHPQLYHYKTAQPVKELISVSEFERLVLRSQKPVMIDFYAHHCPSCMHMLPTYEAVAQQFADHMNFFKVDTMRVPALEEQLNVEQIPCFIVFNRGKPTSRCYAFMDRAQMIALIEHSL